MALIEVNWHPSKKELGIFCGTALGMSIVLASVLCVWRDVSWGVGGTIIAIGVCTALSWFISLRLARLIYVGFIRLTLPIGMTISFTLLLLFYYGLITPVGLVFRLMGRDPLHRKWDKSCASYWHPHPQAATKERYFQQF